MKTSIYKILILKVHKKYKYISLALNSLNSEWKMLAVLYLQVQLT